MGRLRPHLPIVVVAFGAIVLAGYVWTEHVPTRDLVELVALAGGVALLGALAAAGVLRRTRDAALGLQVALVICVPILAVVAGTAVGAQRMFLSSHDLTAVVVMLIAAGTVGCASAVVLGRRVAASSRGLLAATRQLADGQVVDDATDRGAGRELARLRRELRHASERLEEARSRERAIDGSRRELIAWVSHDLRTPLAGIRAIAEALEDGVVSDPETVARYHGTLRAESDRLSGLVDDLFELSQAQAGVVRLEWDRVSLGDLVSDALAGVSPVAEKKGVRLEGRLAADGPDVVGSPPELLRALRNILENAVRHTPADGTIVVEAGQRADQAYVSIQDTGGGIPPEALPRVFEVGFRADPARGREGGAGLGLAIARELVAAHAGEITVENHDGGARFTVRLPVRPAARAAH
jgi:signal transduction histidine kinase